MSWQNKFATHTIKAQKICHKKCNNANTWKCHKIKFAAFAGM